MWTGWVFKTEWARQALYPPFIALEGLVTFWRLSRRFGGFFQPLAGFFQPSGGFSARFCQKSPEIWPRWSFLPPRPQSCSRNHGGRSRRSWEEHRPSSGLNQVSYTSLLLIVSLWMLYRRSPPRTDTALLYGSSRVEHFLQFLSFCQYLLF